MFKISQDRDVNATILELLNKAYELEHKAFRSYMYAAVTVTGPLHDLYEKVYKDFADREQEHLYEIGEKITALGGIPSTVCLSIENITEAVPQGYEVTLAALQEAEATTLEMYTTIHKLGEKAGEITLVLLIEHIMQEEQEHHDELTRILITSTHTTGKNNSPDITAFDRRKYKLASIFTTTPEEYKIIDLAIEQLHSIADETLQLEEEGIDIGPDSIDPRYLRLIKKRDTIMTQLDEIDDDWRKEYSYNSDDELDNEVETAQTMRDFR